MDLERPTPIRDPPRAVARSIRRYDLSEFPRDVVGGVLIVAIGIPISMTMAEVAGLPPVIGLYSCLLAPVAFALLGSSRQLVVALDASTAALLAAAVTPLALGDPARHAALAALVALTVGVVLIVVALLRAGVVAALLSHPVLLGYQAGLAAVVITSQLPKLLGVPLAAEPPVATIDQLIRRAEEIDPASATLGIACLVLIVTITRRSPRVPAPLVAIVLATIAVAVSDALADVAVVGRLPSGMPGIGLPAVTLADVAAVLPAAVAIAVVASADSITSSRAFADRNGYDVDASADMRGLGAANVASGLSGGITISASAARTAVVEMVGVRSQMAGVVAAGLMAVTLSFFTGPLASLPLTALAAVVIAAVARLVDVPGFRQMWRIDRLEWGVGIVTAAASVALGLLHGIAIGVGLSVVVVLGRVGLSRLRSLGSSTVTTDRSGDVVVARPCGPLVYVNVGRVVDRLRRDAGDAGATLRVECDGVPYVDVSAALALATLAGELEDRHVSVVFSGLLPRAAAVLDRADLPDRVLDGTGQAVS